MPQVHEEMDDPDNIEYEVISKIEVVKEDVYFIMVPIEAGLADEIVELAGPENTDHLDRSDSIKTALSLLVDEIKDEKANWEGNPS